MPTPLPDDPSAQYGSLMPPAAGVRSCAPFAILFLTALLAGCSSLPFAPSQPQRPPQVEQEDEHAGPLSTPDVVKWMGIVCTGIGMLLVVASLASWQFPLLNAVPTNSGWAAIVVGVPAMVLADLMAKYMWLTILVALALLGLGIFEYLMKRRWFRKWMNMGGKEQSES